MLQSEEFLTKPKANIDVKSCFLKYQFTKATTKYLQKFVSTVWKSALSEGWQRNGIQLEQILTPFPEPGEDKGLPGKAPPTQYMEA